MRWGCGTRILSRRAMTRCGSCWNARGARSVKVREKGVIMRTSREGDVVRVMREAAHPLSGTSDDFDELLRAIGSSRLVLLGEASHGTDEFYRTRCEITKRLIEEREFNAVVAEADWPDTWRVNRFVRGF